MKVGTRMIDTRAMSADTMGNLQQLHTMNSSNSSQDDETTSLLKLKYLDNMNMGTTSKTTASTSEITTSTQAESSSSNDEESQRSDEVMKMRHSWLIPFFVNIFLACASFSIVMPSLSPYLLEVGASMSYLPRAVASYSVGEMVGSIVIGSFYEYATRTFALGRGPRVSMIMCICFGIVGSVLYASAAWVESSYMAQYFIVAGRFLQGLWTGGQQAIEQAYISAAIEASKKTEFTATLSTCAVLGFVAGPTIGALLSMIDTSVFGLKIGVNNSPGLFILLANSVMLVQTILFFDGKDDRTGEIIINEADEEDQADSSSDSSGYKPFNYMGVAVSMFLFFIHYYSFTLQETIITPLCSIVFDWKGIDVNLLFTCAGVLSLVTSFAVRLLARYLDDRILLVASILIGFVGSVFLMDLPFSSELPIWRFLAGFSMITIAFPIGRNVVLGIFGNVLGPVNQGRWMGAMIAISAFPRIVGPFIALKLLEVVRWKTWLEFGICACSFFVVFALVMQNIDLLVPYEEFLDEFEKDVKRNSGNQMQDVYSPIPSPIIKRSPAVRRKQRAQS